MEFYVAGGSVTGKSHRRASRNCQDAFGVLTTECGTIAVVSDGCGSGRQSEVGAQLGVRLALAALGDQVAAGNIDFDAARLRLLGDLQLLSVMVGPSDRA